MNQEPSARRLRLAPWLLMAAIISPGSASTELQPGNGEASGSPRGTDPARATPAPAESHVEPREQRGSRTRQATPALEEPPIPGFQQLLPRGGIPALVDPEFVAAREADIPDEAWIMGFELDGRAYAYDLNILNHHEVVNHRIGKVPVAAVW